MRALADMTPEAFARWFEASHLVDDDGSPMVLHHATRAQPFERFDATRLGANYRNPVSMTGFFFTAERWRAQSLLDEIEGDGPPRVIAAHVAMRDPALIDARRVGADAASTERLARRIESARALGLSLACARRPGRMGEWRPMDGRSQRTSPTGSATLGWLMAAASP